MELMKRRALLCTVGAASVFGAGGCLNTIDPRETDLTLAWYGLTNYTTESVELDVRVERDGETVHEKTYEVEGRTDGRLGGTIVECSWSGATGDYTVAAREPGSEWVSKSVDEIDDDRIQTGDCVLAEALYRGQTIEFWLRDRCDRITEYSGGCSFVTE